MSFLLSVQNASLNGFPAASCSSGALVLVALDENRRSAQNVSPSNQSPVSVDAPTEGQQSSSTPYAGLSPTEFRRLMDGVLEELGMREYIAVHSRSWKQRRSAIKWLAGAHQVIVSPYGDKLELEAYLQREEVGWVGKLKEMQKRERDHAKRVVESPIVLQIPAVEGALSASK